VLARRLTSHHSTLDQHQAVSALSWGEVLAPVHLLVQQAGTPGQPEDLQVLALPELRQDYKPVVLQAATHRFTALRRNAPPASGG